MSPRTQASIQQFKVRLENYKQRIDQDIDMYCRQLEAEASECFGEESFIATKAFTDILKRGGKRVRGALVMHGYEMSGGTDQQMIIEAARAVEMIHAYILMIDDIQDHSQTRRGGPTAHVALAAHHQEHNLAGQSHHFGISIALNGALLGNHGAQVVLNDLDVSSKLRLRALRIVNQTMVLTAHGQTNDIFNEVLSEINEERVKNVLEWKTAYYTFVSPLQVGMALAGQDDHTLASIVPYSEAAGFAFQITDDILGTFGEAFESGKSSMDDTREGKRTLLVVYALEHAAAADKNYLLTQLGNETLTQAEFVRVQEIMRESGALQYAKDQAADYVDAAVKAVENLKISPEDKHFLQGLAEYLLNRSH